MGTLDLDIIKIDVKQQSSDYFGRVSSCYIDIKAQLRRAVVTSRKRIAAGGVNLTWELRTISNKLLGTAFMDSDDLDDGSLHVDCLVLDKQGKGQTLLLEKVPDSDMEYYRIGVAELFGLDEDDDSFVSGSEQMIRLV
jgi:hypothetical protein